MPLKKKIIFTERDLKNIYNQEVKIIFLNNWYYLNFKKNIKNLKYEVLKHYSYTSNEQHYHHLQCEQIYEKCVKTQPEKQILSHRAMLYFMTPLPRPLLACLRCRTVQHPSQRNQ